MLLGYLVGDAMMTAVGNPCSGEEELMRVRYVLSRPTSYGWNTWLGVWLVVCFVWVFGLVLLVCCLVGLCWCFVAVVLGFSSIHFCLFIQEL